MRKGCGNHGCRVSPPKGQAPNGPCRCRRPDDPFKVTGTVEAYPDDNAVEILKKRDEVLAFIDEQIECLIEKRDPSQMRETILELTRHPVPNAYLRRALECIFRGTEAARDVMFMVREMITDGELVVCLNWEIAQKDWRKYKEEAKR